VWAVVVAAGRGERLGGSQPKSFAKLGGRALLAESLERLDLSDWIEAIVVVTPPDWEEPTILLAEELGAGKVTAAVPGGETRADSVRAGLAETPENVPVVLVHDAARPFLSEAVLERVLSGLGDGVDGVVPALPLADTVKRANGHEVVETLDRNGLYAVQTPQAFVAAVLRSALADVGRDGSDCAAYVEAAGGRIRLVDGDPALFKITTAADLTLAERFLGDRDE
jgi:2-C-methyl-D-erythritol 4-phosphate cytidylyltransferase